MKAMRLHGINDFRLEELEKPVPKGKEILLKVEACGICGSDIPRVYQLGTKVYPVTLGHEFAGEIIAVGEDADPNLIGKAGAVYPVVPCGVCDSCRIGQYAQCSNYHNLGSRTDGGFAQYCLLPSQWHFIQSNNSQTSMEELAMVEPATVALHAIRKGEIKGGDTAMIFGAGPIGILTARWCELFGIQTVLVDIDQKKVDYAREKGFETIHSLLDDCKEKVKEMTNGKMADVVIEGTGTSSAMNHAVECCRPEGMIVLLGNPRYDTTIELDMHSMILRKELRLTGVWNNYYNTLPFNEWEYTVKMLDERKLKVADLITHRSDLEHLKELFDDIHDGKITICKAMYSEAAE